MSLSAVLNTLLPGSGLADSLGGLSLLEQMALMLVISLPLYVCATASIPIAASLVVAGAEPAAVLIFLIAGPATNAVAVSALTKILGWKHLLIQLLVVIFGSILGALFFSSYIKNTKAMELHDHEVGLWSQAGAVLLIMLFSRNLWAWLKTKFLVKEISSASLTFDFKVEGMNCGSCVKKIRAALESKEGVGAIEIDLQEARLKVESTGASIEELIQAVENLGFKLSQIV